MKATNSLFTLEPGSHGWLILKLVRVADFWLVAKSSMGRLLFGLLLLCMSMPSWCLTSDLSQCLLTTRINNAACTDQIIRFESQHAYVAQIAGNHGVDPDLVLAIIAVESSFTSLNLADRGGVGPMQVTAIAARDLGVTDLTYLLSDTVNVQIGTQYLRKMMQRFGDWRLALAAYNAGPGAVQKYRSIPPYRETVDYVRQVLWWYVTFKNTSV
ncbi:MAG: lytic transglycosylase domain-containing protein [Fluviibacter sp.]